ncbi:hypothetical protein [Xenorhabdus sp. TS4]|uniref:hypothetical protein n=1 Tax=Xenorhabdus sp. TS4 TaxID=1873483 RepID=UPI001656F4A9|nr:hypothetical protein [Xenorhabdus sp. TS4]MBC8949404.1 hypothetical protein [Xenorhabdus sp. TS4]
MGQYRHTVSNVMTMASDELIQKTVQWHTYDEGKFYCFLDEPKYKPKYRLNIVGHSSPPGSSILFWGTMLQAHGMNQVKFCSTVHKLVTGLKNKGQNIQSIRIIACYSGTNGLAQLLANHLHMPVKGCLGGTRMSSTASLRPNLHITRYLIDKPDRDSQYFPEERDRQLRHDPGYGLYRWYDPQTQQSDSDSEFDAFVSQRVPRENRR